MQIAECKGYGEIPISQLQEAKTGPPCPVAGQLLPSHLAPPVLQRRDERYHFVTPKALGLAPGNGSIQEWAENGQNCLFLTCF